MRKVLSKNWAVRLGYCALGVGIALSQPPIGLFYLLFLTLPLLGWIFKEQTKSFSAFWLGGWVGFGYFGLTLSWIIEPFLVEPEIFGWMAPFALFFMAAGGALFWAVPFFIAKKIGKTAQSQVILLACLWTVFEYFRSIFFTGFPWSLLAYSWIDTPIAQLGSWVGVHGLGLITLCLMFAPVAFPKRAWHVGALCLSLFAGFAIYGIYRIPDEIPSHPDGTIIRLIQPNAPQHLKWRSDMIPIFFHRAVKLTATPVENRPDVVIWPEASLPFLLGENPNALQIVADSAGPQTQVIVGIRRVDEYGGYNSLVYLDEKGMILSVYDKHHLVPFGEYLPFENIMRKFGLSAIADNIGGFVSGAGPRILSGNSIPNFLPMICYEVIFPYSARVANQRADWMVHITNDAWYGTILGPFQHLAQTKMRAIEQGLPIARSANTGISGMIDPYGQMKNQLKLGIQGYIDAVLPAPLNPTLYSRFSEVPWMIFVLLLSLFAIVSQYVKKRR